MARTGHSKVEVLMGYLRRAGRGRPAPFIGPLGGDARAFLSAAALPRALGPSEVAPVAAMAHRRLGELVAAAAAPDRTFGARAHRPKVKAEERPLAAVAAEFPAGRPAEVMARAEGRYRRAYLVAQRAGESPEACRQRGGASKRAFLGAWAKAQKAQSKAAAVVVEVNP
jgi:hypothetical protein